MRGRLYEPTGERLGINKEDMNSFRKLNVYIKSKQLVREVYELLTQFPSEERFALCDQLRRAVVSVPSNIAEGMGRMTDKDQAHFLSLAYGSLMEVLAQLDVACDLGYLTPEKFANTESLIVDIAKMLSSLISIRTTSPVAKRPLTKSDEGASINQNK